MGVQPYEKLFDKIVHAFRVTIGWTYFAQICYIENTLKFVMAGVTFSDNRNYTLVFDSQSNSWHEGAPLLLFPDYTSSEAQCFLNGVIYMLVGDPDLDDQELREVGDVDQDNILYKIIGYDVNQDQWAFSILVHASIGFVFCLTEWEGSLFVYASNSTHEENQFELVASWDGCDGHFVFWILDTDTNCGFENEN